MLKRPNSAVPVSRSKLEQLPLFWKYALMMTGILLLCLIALLLIHRSSLKTLENQQLKKMQLSLERDCEALAESMYATQCIPESISTSVYYRYIQSDRAASLPLERFSVMRSIRDALSNQVYLRGDGSEIIMLFPNINTICTTQRFTTTAEQYFTDYTIFSETDVNVILGHFFDKGSMYLLPMQHIKLDMATKSERYLPLIIHPQSNALAVMTLYSEEAVLKNLGVTDLPEGTRVEIKADDGRILMQSPAEAFSNPDESSHVLSAPMQKVGATVSLWIPATYFTEQILPVKRTGAVTILAVMTLGLLMALLFSRASVRPIQRLIRVHGKESHSRNTNEITRLDHLLLGARENSERLKTLYVRQILARALTGSVLSVQDEQRLNQGIRDLNTGYRIAILHTTEEINELVGEHIQHEIPHAAWAILNNLETGLLLPSDEAHAEQLTQLINSLNQKTDTGCILCGISTPATDFSGFHRAVRQARAAMPQNAGVRLFAGTGVNDAPITWLQHERLYQSIFGGEEEDAKQLLAILAQSTNHENAREVFYNIRFVIRSAAGELGISLTQQPETEYLPNLLPGENISRMEAMLSELFTRIREKNEQQTAVEQLAMLDYIQSNLGDYAMCAALVAEHFGTLEQYVYKIVRSHTDMSFNAYLTQLRMKQAAVLLCTTQIGISEIWQRCGYRVESTFYRQFRDYYGMTPKQYRSGLRQPQE